MPGTLYLIPNTLGATDPAPHALSHILPQQVQAITSQLGYFVAENAKTARAFLKLVAIDHPLARPLQEIRIAELNVNTPAQALAALLAPLLAGEDAGLVSEAGVPAVADPGADLVRLAHQHGIPVRPLVGPSSLLLAVMASGLNGQSFAFNGYLPTDAAQRTKRIQQLEQRSRAEKQTQLLIETPYRNAAMLETCLEALQPATRLAIACGLTLAEGWAHTRGVAQWKAAKAALPDRVPAVFSLLA